MKRILVTMLLVIVSGIGLVAGLFGIYKLSELAEGIGTTSIESQELPIAEKYISVGRFGKQTTTFVVIYEDEEYTLPQVSTSLVRTYSEGDTLPVKVYIYEDDNYKLQIDTAALRQR